MRDFFDQVRRMLPPGRPFRAVSVLIQEVLSENFQEDGEDGATLCTTDFKRFAMPVEGEVHEVPVEDPHERGAATVDVLVKSLAGIIGQSCNDWEHAERLLSNIFEGIREFSLIVLRTKLGKPPEGFMQENAGSPEENTVNVVNELTAEQAASLRLSTYSRRHPLKGYDSKG